MYRIGLVLVLVLVLLSTTVFADSSGQAVYESTCAACHGVDANGIDALSTPKLRGQHAPYLKRQLAHFRQGVRFTGRYAQTMGAIAQDLTMAQIATVTQYLASLEPGSPSFIADTGSLFSGRNCVSCHGEDGRSSAWGVAPSLAGQNPWYVERQLQDFRDGNRGSHKSDLRGRMMRPQAESLSDEQIKALGKYVSTL